MTLRSRTRILLVDDEQNLLDGLTRMLRRHYDITTATSGTEGLKIVNSSDPFAVVVSDLRMPGMDGVQFLSEVRQSSPDTVRVLLTGNADINSAIDAVNQGAIFRFLTKPCSMDALLQALASAEAQHQLITAERVLLENTLRGSIKALTDVLALVNPAAFGRAVRAKQQVEVIASAMQLKSAWQLEIAAMLSQIGAVTLPPETVSKLYEGAALSPSEQQAAARLPKVASDLVANIPRLEDVRDILAYLSLRYDGEGSPAAAPRGKALPLGSRLLKIIFDLDILESQGTNPQVALRTLHARSGAYDPDLLAVFDDVIGTGAEQQIVEVDLWSVRPGMVFAEDIKASNGVLLIARGQEVSERLVERIQNLLPRNAVQRKVRMLTAAAGTPSGAGRAAGGAPPQTFAVAG